MFVAAYCITAPAHMSSWGEGMILTVVHPHHGMHSAINGAWLYGYTAWGITRQLCQVRKTNNPKLHPYNSVYITF